MVGTEHGDQQARRRFITRHHVEDAAAAGQPVRVQGRDVLTDEAAQRAADLGVQIERDQVKRDQVTGTASRPSVLPSASPVLAAAVPAGRAEPDADLRRAIRAAVVAELGAEPPGLDAAIDRVLRSRSR